MPEAFGSLLRRLRIAANLSQEALAEEAGVSAGAIGSYERGLRTSPHRDSVALLASALGLTGSKRSEFEAAARRKSRPRVAKIDATAVGNLPLETTSFIGREPEVEQILEMLGRHHLVTLTGEGGIGKTRLALRIASRISYLHIGGAWFVDFSTLTSAGSVVGAFASVFNLPFSGLDSPFDAVTSILKDRDVFIVLDGCEPVVGDAARLAAALGRNCPNVKLLATSRISLNIMGEAIFRVPALPVPPVGSTVVRDTRNYAAVELFVDRAKMRDHRFSYSERDVVAVIDICRRLDGIPLAIELAASQLHAFGIAALHAQIDELLPAKSLAKRDAPARQQTLRATLLWSYDLLDEQERISFRRLSVFAGGWTLDAAEAVCMDDLLSTAAVRTALTGLCEHCLVNVSIATDPARYTMHENTRLLALEKSTEAGEGQLGARRHAAWIESTAHSANREYRWKPRIDWHARYDAEIENVRKALRWSLAEASNPAAIADIIDGFRGLWVDGGRIDELRAWLTSALSATREDEHPRAFALLLWSLANAIEAGEEQIKMIRRAIDLFDAAGDPEGSMRGWYQLASHLARLSGDPVELEHAFREAISRIEDCGLATSTTMASILTQRGMYTIAKGGDARADLARALSVSISLQDYGFAMHVRGAMAENAFGRGDPRSAADQVDEILQSEVPILSRDRMYLLVNRAAYRLALGDLDLAEEDAREALELGRDGDFIITLYSIGHLATIFALRGVTDCAARLLGYVEARYQQTGIVRSTTEQRGYEMLIASLRSQRSDDEIAELGREGALFSDATAILTCDGGANVSSRTEK